MKFYRVNALLYKYLKISTNRLERIFDIVYWPVIDLFIWGFVLRYINKLGAVHGSFNFIFGGIILWVFCWRAQQDIAVYVLEDFWSRSLYNLFASPLKLSELVVSLFIFSLMRSILTFGFLFLIAFVLFSFNIFTINLTALALFVLALLLIGWVMGIFISGVIFRYGMQVQILAWSVAWLIQPFSCVFYPLSSLPGWAQKVAVWLPTTHVFEGLRQVINTGIINWNGLAYAYISSLVLLVLSCLFFKRCVEKAKKLNLLTSHE